MRKISKVALSLGTAATVGVSLASANAVAAAGRPARTAASTTQSLGQPEAGGLAFSREEERMAHDLYTVFAEKYGATVFSRIASSEQRHFDAVGSLLTRYSVADPASQAKPGVYADPAIQALYDGWKAEGLTSASAAYKVGVQLEKRDIADLQRLQKQTANADLDRVYGNLERASGHHLAAFESAVAGKTPTAAGRGQNARQNARQDAGQMSGQMRGRRLGGHGQQAGHGTHARMHG